MENTLQKRVIVTGATGFIGGWLVRLLSQKSIEVTALTTGSGRVNEIENVHWVHYDPNSVALAVDELGRDYDAFYHLGWAGVAASHKNDITIQMRNVHVALDLLQLAHVVGCKRFVGAGTVGEYVYCDGLISPAQSPSPADVYGAAKVATKHLCLELAKQLSMTCNWTILPSTYGEGRGDDNLLAYVITSVLSGISPQCTKLEPMWDFLYVNDIARALWLIGEKGIPGKTYGIGSGVYKPLLNYVTEIRDMINPSAPLAIGAKEYPGGLLPSSCVDNSELIKDTGFSVHTRFGEGIRKTIEYYRKKCEE